MKVKNLKRLSLKVLAEISKKLLGKIKDKSEEEIKKLEEFGQFINCLESLPKEKKTKLESEKVEIDNEEINLIQALNKILNLREESKPQQPAQEIEVGKEYSTKNDKVCKVLRHSHVLIKDSNTGKFSEARKLGDGYVFVIFRDSDKSYNRQHTNSVSKKDLKPYTSKDTKDVKPQQQLNSVAKSMDYYYNNEMLPLFLLEESSMGTPGGGTSSTVGNTYSTDSSNTSEKRQI
jgi:hypothetical protein